MIEKNEKSGELMEVKEQAKTVRKHPERMIVRIWLVLALICLLAGLIAQYTFRLKEPLFLHYSQSAYLGCGLDDTGRSCDNGCCKLYNLDFPDVIALRDALLPAGEREENIPCDLNDYSWFDRIDASGGAVFFAAGVFYYFLTEQFQTLVQAMAQAFPGGRLVFDAAGKAAVKMMLKTWIRDAEIKDVGAYFSVSDARRELSPWAPGLQVSSRGYMLGYQSLDDLSVKGLYRLLARIGDGWMKMQIVRMEFGGLV